ncbi:MAG: hypothetical protein ABIL69_06930 [candidate division WOR-3 bacterium]
MKNRDGETRGNGDREVGRNKTEIATACFGRLVCLRQTNNDDRTEILKQVQNDALEILYN